VSPAIVKTTASDLLDQRRVFKAACLLIGGLGAVHAWGDRHFMNPDGVSYLDIGGACARGDWAAAINGYWSPLYAWLLGAALAVFQPSSQTEFAFAHLVNLASFLGALASFGFFLRVLMERVAEIASAREPLPKRPLLILGYALFAWSSLDLIEIRQVTPDMLVAALVYLAAGLALRFRGEVVGVASAAALGAALGFGYLAKTAMLPVALVFVAALAAGRASLRVKSQRGLTVLVSFAVVAAPWVATLSLTKGRLAFGDAGKLNYSWFVDGQAGALKNAPRKLLEEPAVVAYGTAVGGSNPRRYDPSYWWEGMEPAFNLRKQISVLGRSAFESYKLFVERGGAFLAGAVVMWLLARKRVATPQNAARGLAVVWMPALAALAMYGLIQFEPRYVGAFVVLIWMSVFGGLWAAGASARKRLCEMLVWGMVAVASLTIVVSTCRVVGRGLRYAEPPQWPVANELHALGVRAGDKVGYIGPDDSSFWARMAKVRIVAEMESRDGRWASDAALRSKVIQAFKDGGAMTVVARVEGGALPKEEWRRLGRDDYFAFLMPQRNP
jgi:MFS family permease